MKKQNTKGNQSTQIATLPNGGSLFDLPAFPSITKRFAFAPKDILNALTLWESSGINIKKACEKCGLRWKTLLQLIDQYPEIRHRYECAKSRKAETLVNETEEMIKRISPTFESKPGIYQGNIAEVRKAELLMKHRQWYAGCVNKSYKNTTHVETVNTNVNLNGEIKLTEQSTLAEILQAMRQTNNT
jgi:hypothetical protein